MDRIEKLDTNEDWINWKNGNRKNSEKNWNEKKN